MRPPFKKNEHGIKQNGNNFNTVLVQLGLLIKKFF